MLSLSGTHAEGMVRLWKAQVDLLERVGRDAARSAGAVLSDTDGDARSVDARDALPGTPPAELCSDTMDVMECWRAMYRAACEYEAMNEVRARLARFLSDRQNTFHRNLAMARTAEQERRAAEEPAGDAADASIGGLTAREMRFE
jgi:hypothetical protein